MAGKKHSGKFQKKRTYGTGRILLIIAAILLTLVIVGLIVGIWYYQSLLDRIPRVKHTPTAVAQTEIDSVLEYNPDEPVQTVPDTQPQMPTTVEIFVPDPNAPRSEEDIVNVMVIGQSARPGELYHMADSIILVTINKVTKTMTLTSFLRDTYLKLPDYRDLSGRLHSGGYDRLNVCYHNGYSYGGTADAMQMLNQCVYENFGIQVDFNIEVGFDGVMEIVNYVGGIEVDLTEAEAAYLNEDDLYVYGDVQPGPTLLDGMATLSYMRMRNAEGDGGSDIRRTARQRLVLEKLMGKIRQINVRDMTLLMDQFLPYVVTDMTNEDITGCILDVFPIIGDLKIETGTCPADSTYWAEITDLTGYDSILRYDEEQNRALMQVLTEG